MPEAQRDAVDRLGLSLERLAAASGFDTVRQPNGNRVAASIKKGLQMQTISGSANGNRTRDPGSRPLPSNTRESFSVRVFAFLSPG
jgi:hypothetical protein